MTLPKKSILDCFYSLLQLWMLNGPIKETQVVY